MYLQHKALGTIVEIPNKPVTDADGCVIGGPSYMDQIKGYTEDYGARFETLRPECPRCHGTGIERAFAPGVMGEGSCLPCSALKPKRNRWLYVAKRGRMLRHMKELRQMIRERYHAAACRTMLRESCQDLAALRQRYYQGGRP